MTNMDNNLYTYDQVIRVFGGVLAESLKQLDKLEPVQIVRCKDCKYYAGEGMYCEQNICVQFDHFYCYYGEREDNHYKMGKMLTDNFYNGVSFWREWVDKRCEEICKDYTESDDKK